MFGSLIGRFTTVPMLYVIGALLLFVGAEGLWIKHLDAKLIVAKHDTDLANQQLGGAVADNNANVAANKTLKSELATCTNIKELAIVAENTLIVTAQAREAKLRQEVIAARNRRAQIYATPACASATTPICMSAEKELRDARAALIKGN